MAITLFISMVLAYLLMIAMKLASTVKTTPVVNNKASLIALRDQVEEIRADVKRSNFVVLWKSRNQKHDDIQYMTLSQPLQNKNKEMLTLKNIKNQPNQHFFTINKSIFRIVPLADLDENLINSLPWHKGLLAPYVLLTDSKHWKDFDDLTTDAINIALYSLTNLK